MMRRGFTLVGFITALMIVTILAAILFPVFARATEKARQASCVSNLLNIGKSLRHYAAEYNGRYPPEDDNLDPLLYQYLPDRGCLDCPSNGTEYDFKSRDYSYRGGYATDDLTTLVLAMDRRTELHNGGANVLFNDGHAKWLQESRIEKNPEFRSMPDLDRKEDADRQGGSPP